MQCESNGLLLISIDFNDQIIFLIILKYYMKDLLNNNTKINTLFSNKNKLKKPE